MRMRQREKIVEDAAIRLLLHSPRYRHDPPYELGKARQHGGVDLPLYWGDWLVAMVEVKSQLDFVVAQPGDDRKTYKCSPLKHTAYTGLGQVMYHGRAEHPDLPLAVLIGASAVKNGRPILTSISYYVEMEPDIRSHFAKLDVHFIVCGQSGDVGAAEFMKSVDQYAKRVAKAVAERELRWSAIAALVERLSRDPADFAIVGHEANAVAFMLDLAAELGWNRPEPGGDWSVGAIRTRLATANGDCMPELLEELHYESKLRRDKARRELLNAGVG
jgi:hypothetical protein